MRFKHHHILILLVFIVAACQQEKANQAPLPPPRVTVIEAQAQDVEIPIEFVGQTHGAQDIAIRARVEGFLEGIHFEEGSEVTEGQLLYTLESQPHEAEVAAMMSRLAEAKTKLAKATSDLNRIRPLAKGKAVSQSDLDGAVAAYEASKASVQAAQAALKASQVKLSYTRINSPISGIIGKTKAQVGDFVGRSPNPVILNTVSNISTIRVVFFITENQYLSVARQIRDLRQGKVKPDEERPIKLILADESLYSHTGKFDFIDRSVDPATGSILVQVSFSNPDKIIRPGQFAKIQVISERITEGIVVPQRCISELQGIDRVFVVGSDNKVEERKVSLGPTLGSKQLILEGLQAGEKIIYEGLQKVADGVTVNPEITTVKPTEIEKQ